MKNKIECEKAVGEICEMCFKKHELEYGHQPINCAFREFDNEDCPTVKVLKDLIQEHFEEKSETNYEHFKDEIIQNVKYALAVVNGEPKSCANTNCDECEFKESGKCVERVIEWLNKQYKKPPYKLSRFNSNIP